MDPSDINEVKIINEKNVSAADVIKEANQIWDKAQAVWNGIKPMPAKKGKPQTIKASDFAALDELHKRITDEHRQFAQAYPTVLRHMVQEKWYSPAAFKEYMKKLEKQPWTNDAERMDSYTLYAELLMRETNKSQHLNQSTINAFKRDYRERIQKEHDQFVEDYKKLQKKLADEEKVIEESKRADLLAAFKRLAPQANVTQQRIEDMVELINKGVINTPMLVSVVNDLRRILAGESVAVLQKEYQDHRNAVNNANTPPATTKIHIPDEMDKIHAERVRKLALEQTARQEQAQREYTTYAAHTASDNDPDADIDDKVQ